MVVMGAVDAGDEGLAVEGRSVEGVLALCGCGVGGGREGDRKRKRGLGGQVGACWARFLRMEGGNGPVGSDEVVF